jgi:hypothetical protein
MNLTRVLAGKSESTKYWDQSALGTNEAAKTRER